MSADPTENRNLHQCPVCLKPMVWEPPAANSEPEGGWVFDCTCLDAEPAPWDDSQLEPGLEVDRG